MRTWLANRLAYGIYIHRFLKRNRAVRGILLNTLGMFMASWVLLGPETTLGILGLILRMVSMIGFLMIQFIGLFWFLSRSKSITIVPGDKTDLTLSDYKGQPALLKLMGEWLKILKGSSAFVKMGGLPPSGMILYGPPGTGKTYLLKCLAGSAGIALHSLEGSSFSAMFIGVPVLKTLAFVNKARNLAREHGACVVPGTPILTADLRWIPVERLAIGDEIFGIDEQSPGGHKKRRTTLGRVEFVGRRIEPLYRVVTDRGSVVASQEHPLLAHSPRGMRGNLSWTAVRGLQPGQAVKFLAKPWESESSDTWLAGMLDGEGCLAFGRGAGRALGVDISQLPGPVLDRVIAEVERRGLTAHLYHGKNASHVVVSSLAEALELLGRVRPMRLLEKFSRLFFDKPPALGETNWATVQSVEYVGEGEVVSLQTSCHTYVANGFVSHNCIAYIDEIDALGSARGGQQGGMALGGFMGGSGGMGALTTLLAEVDGMGSERNMTIARNEARRWLRLPPIHEGFVFWTGGTNRPQVLDVALTRPGRLEHLIAVDPPDGPGRREIFVYYLDKVKNEGVDVDILVAQTQGITPAAIQSAIQRSGPRIALSEGRDQISRLDISRALIEQVMGLANPIGDLPQDQKWQICVHEASHAVASWVLRKDQHIAFVSAIRRGAALGFMMPVQKESTYSVPLTTLIADIRVSLAGDVGTRLILGQRWTGAATDLEHVRQRVQYLAWHGVFGGIVLDAGPHSPEMVKKIEEFMTKQWDATETLLAENEKRVRALAKALLVREEMSGDEATRIIEEAL